MTFGFIKKFNEFLVNYFEEIIFTQGIYRSESDVRNLQFIVLILSKLKILYVTNLTDMSERLSFKTALITYPSDFNKLLTAQRIVEYYKSKGLLTATTKLVISQEDPDEDIKRVHFHLYWDDIRQKNIRGTRYYDIPLEYPILAVYVGKYAEDYFVLNELESQLGWDNGAEMVAKLDDWIKEKGYERYKILEVAHANIKVKKGYYGSKYEMLRYVLKTRLFESRKELNVDEEYEWLLENKEELEEKLKYLIEEEKVVDQCNVQTIDELILLLDDLKKKKIRELMKKEKKSKKRGRRSKKQVDDEELLSFTEFLRISINNEKMTKIELLKQIKADPYFWTFYSKNYLNYNKLINDLFKGKSPTKPKRNYDFKFWLPKKLYNYVMWLNDWVRRWMSGEKMESRPKGLIIIGPSRTGKTSLISLLGEFSYFKNVWNVDNWEGLTAFNVMDDMDAGDEGKGLSFCWFKPFFGAQDAITVTDKFKPKQDIVNGKPLIWLNNYDYTETFQSKTAQDYIRKNMEIVYINQPLYEKPEPFEWIEGHSDYIEFDPKTTWYYKNIVCTKNQSPDNASTLTNNSECVFVDETEKVIEKAEEIEPLNFRKERILSRSPSVISVVEEEEKDDYENVEFLGRPFKRIRTENSSL